MRRTRLALLAASLGLFWALAVQAGDALFPHGVLWRLQRPGVPSSYLLGTLHSEEPPVLALAPPVRAAFRTSRHFVMEVVPGAGEMSAILHSMMLPPEQSLERLLAPALYRKAVAVAAGYGLPEVEVRRYKPWALATTLSLPRPKSGLFLDNKLYAEARAAGMDAHGLETVAEQLDIFDRLSLAEQISMLTDALENRDKVERDSQALLQAYLQRDLAALWRIQEESQQEGDVALNRRLARQLIDERNARMVRRMAPYLAEGRSFIAVGALHLPGPHGLLERLRAQGWRVSPVY